MHNKKCDVVVLTCDKYEDAWEPFFILKNRYWKNCEYKTYLITETKKCKYCETININEDIWSKRVREGLSKLKSDYVIILLEDFFIRENVDSKRINFCLNNFPKSAACFNFEISLDNNDIESDIEGFKIKTKESNYKCSCQAALWDRKKLIELLSYDCNPWVWETSEPIKDYDFYINKDKEIFNYGKNKIIFGILQGKWYKKDVVPLFKKENINIDFSKRGFYKEENILIKTTKFVGKFLRRLKVFK